MNADLLAQRQAVIDAHAKLEKTRGSGWHPADPGAMEREERSESNPFGRGEIPLSERPVLFLDDDQVHLCGPDVPLVLGAAKEWLATFEPQVNSSSRADLRYAVKCVKRILDRPPADILTLFASEWNSLNLALSLSRPDANGEFQGIQVVSQSVKA